MNLTTFSLNTLPDEPQEVKQPQPAEPQPVDPNRPTQEGVANVEDYDKGYSFGIDETQGFQIVN